MRQERQDRLTRDRDLHAVLYSLLAMLALLVCGLRPALGDEVADPSTEPSDAAALRHVFEIQIKAELSRATSSQDAASIVFVGPGRAVADPRGVALRFDVLTARGQRGQAEVRWDNPLPYRPQRPQFAGRGRASVRLPNAHFEFPMVVRGTIQRSRDLRLLIHGSFESVAPRPTPEPTDRPNSPSDTDGRDRPRDAEPADPQPVPRARFAGRFGGVSVEPDPRVAFGLRVTAVLERAHQPTPEPITFRGPGRAHADREGVRLRFDVLTADGQHGEAEIRWRNPLEYRPRLPRFAGRGEATVRLPGAEHTFRMAVRGTISRARTGDLIILGRFGSVSDASNPARLTGRFVGIED